MARAVTSIRPGRGLRIASPRWARFLLLAAASTVPTAPLQAQEGDTRYRVQVAAIAEREAAVREARRVHRLMEGGHAVYVFEASPFHAVRVGDFVSAPAARRLLLRVRALGFADAWLAKARPDAPMTVLRAGEAIVELPPVSPPPADAPTGVAAEPVTASESTADRVSEPVGEVAVRLPPATVSSPTRLEVPRAGRRVESERQEPRPTAPVVRLEHERPEPATGPSETERTPQEARRVRAQVEQIAGATLYLDVGTEAGVAAGDTVSVARDTLGPAAGRLVVVSSTGSRSVLAFAGDPFPIVRGQILFVTPRRGPAPAIASETQTRQGADRERAWAERRSTRETEARRSTGTAPTVRGRISFDVDATRSTARYGSGDEQAVDRTFATPTLRFRARVSDLPGDLQLHANTRLSYRYTDSPFPSDPTSMRVYELSLVKTFRSAPLYVRAGRFYNPYESYSGYWDGLLVRAGTRSAGLGVAVGFQPDRWNQGVSSDLPKLSVFGDARWKRGRTRYEVDVSAHRVQPNNGLFRHTFFGLSQELRVGALRLSQDLQLDEDPVEGGWEITRFRVNAGIDVNREVTLRANISRDRPYRLWDTLTVISYPRDQVGAGLTVRVAGGTVGADVAVNRDLDERIGRSYSSFFRFPRGGPLGLGVNGSARYWEGFGYRVLSLSPGLSRSFGSTRAQLSYRFYRSEYDERELLTHTVEGGLSVLVGRGLRYSLQASSQWGPDLFSGRVYTGLAKNF